MPGFSGEIPLTGQRVNTDRPVGGIVMPILTAGLMVIALLMAVGVALRGANLLSGVPVVGDLTRSGVQATGVGSKDGVPSGLERFA